MCFDKINSFLLDKLQLLHVKTFSCRERSQFENGTERTQSVTYLCLVHNDFAIMSGCYTSTFSFLFFFFFFCSVQQRMDTFTFLMKVGSKEEVNNLLKKRAPALIFTPCEISFHCLLFHKSVFTFSNKTRQQGEKLF